MLIALVLLALVGTAAARMAPACRPHRKQCSPYDVVASYPDKVELRHYPQQQWVSTSMCMPALDNEGEMKTTTFRKLKQYIRGNNNAGKQITMAFPVVTKFHITGTEACPVNATRSFYLTEPNPPQPTDATMFLETKEEMNLYTRAFRGDTSKQAHVDNFIVITRVLGDESLYEQAFFYVVDYKLPGRNKQYHESWLVAVEQMHPH